MYKVIFLMSIGIVLKQHFEKKNGNAKFLERFPTILFIFWNILLLIWIHCPFFLLGFERFRYKSVKGQGTSANQSKQPSIHPAAPSKLPCMHVPRANLFFVFPVKSTAESHWMSHSGTDSHWTWNASCKSTPESHWMSHSGTDSHWTWNALWYWNSWFFDTVRGASLTFLEYHLICFVFDPSTPFLRIAWGFYQSYSGTIPYYRCPFKDTSACANITIAH
jgi:hypothetical protein